MARARVLPMVVLSVALHGVAWASIARVRPPARHERIELEVVRRERPRPPPPKPAPVAEKPRPRVVALAAPVAPPPPPAAPPPPLASAPQAPPPPGAPRPLPKVGISLGSTVASGGFAVGVGNTVYGKADERAADPSTVRPYAGGFVPAARVSSQPKVLELPKIEYPADARRDGVEGQVRLLLRVDARGAVTAVRVLDAPTPSLGAAAAEGARRFRFSPALVDGAVVETEIRFTYTFLLE